MKKCIKEENDVLVILDQDKYKDYLLEQVKYHCYTLELVSRVSKTNGQTKISSKNNNVPQMSIRRSEHTGKFIVNTLLTKDNYVWK